MNSLVKHMGREGKGEREEGERKRKEGGGEGGEAQLNF
jgi:hypothetical protein